MQVPVVDADNCVVNDKKYQPPSTFPIGPFTRYEHNPILVPDQNREFESGYLYNATAIVVDDRVWLLYRAQSTNKTSSVGLAWSSDGVTFTKYPKPIIYPTEPWEAKGGCEDPRIVFDYENKRFVVTYTGYDSKTARLCVAYSKDLLNWTKLPPFVKPSKDGEQGSEWSKSGAIFNEKVNGRYWMVYGEGNHKLAYSEDMINWTMAGSFSNPEVFTVPRFPYESRLIEPGPAPIKLTTGQWAFLYNASTNGDDQLGLEPTTYTLSQMLVDLPAIEQGPVARLERPFMRPESDNEKNGQVDKVVFCEGVVQFHGKWFLYYGQGDSELGVAFADVV
ncbi:hypothetical protein DIURU_003520 [Diutina rugosa]|uniref:Glycosyl hydrolase family 32 N-terminal domain-containing protein n=1 Tax=Diutina rugosa TaxID=5481 RepID=A0A642UL67_DIURU|nr:uncharacterized protein DIURU_003520 [Diutina rugosa]KAA8901150.1 hypothetical protein DIURU_003520 [Diutina rugosa]